MTSRSLLSTTPTSGPTSSLPAAPAPNGWARLQAFSPPTHSNHFYAKARESFSEHESDPAIPCSQPSKGSPLAGG